MIKTGVVTVRQTLWTAKALHQARALPRAYDETALDEKEQRLANAIMSAVRKELGSFDKKLDAATSKYEQVLSTIDENLKQLETEVGDDDEEAPAPKAKARARAAVHQDDDDDEPEGEEPPIPADLPEEMTRRLAFERRRNEKRIRKLEEQVADRDKKAVVAERAARDSMTSKILGSAVAQANAVDPRAAAKLLLMEKVRWDDEKGYPIYTTSEGAEFPMTDDNYDSFAEAVKDDMPDWMRRAAAGSGGSGATPAKAADRLDMARRELEALTKNAEGNDDHAIARMHAKRREIEGLQADVEKGGRK